MKQLKILYMLGFVALAAGIFSEVSAQTLYKNEFPSTDPLTGWIHTTDPGIAANTDYSYGVDSEFYHRTNSIAGTQKTMQSYFNGTDLQGHAVTDGTWRDVSVVSIVRSLNNIRAGIGLRLDTEPVSNNPLTTNPLTTNGYWVGYVNNSGWKLGICRWNNGNAKWLGYSDVISGFENGKNSYLQTSIQNISTGNGTDEVLVSINLYKDSTMKELWKSFTYTDSSADAITRAGGVGYQSRINSSGYRAVYDNLSITTLSPGLLYYDDFSDGQAKNMTLSERMSVADGKLVHRGGSTNATALGYVSSGIDERWENVSVSTSIYRSDNNGMKTLGVIARMQDDKNSFYHFRIQDQDQYKMIHLLRFANGQAATLTTLSLPSEGLDYTKTIYMRLNTLTRSDGVYLVGEYSYDSDFSSIIQRITGLDSSSSALKTAGSAGVRNVGGEFYYDQLEVSQLSAWTDIRGGSWTDAANWSSTVVPNWAGAVADFSMVNPTSNVTVQVAGTQTVGSLIFGDTIGTTHWRLVSDATAPGTLEFKMDNAGGGNSSIYVYRNSTARLETELTGTNPIVVNLEGGSTLELAGNFNHTGDWTIHGGTVLLGEAASSFGAGKVALDGTQLTTEGIHTITFQKGLTLEDGVVLNFDVSKGASDQIVLSTLEGFSSRLDLDGVELQIDFAEDFDISTLEFGDTWNLISGADFAESALPTLSYDLSAFSGAYDDARLMLAFQGENLQLRAVNGAYVPEPGTWGMLLLGLALLMRKRQKRI